MIVKGLSAKRKAELKEMGFTDRTISELDQRVKGESEPPHAPKLLTADEIRTLQEQGVSLQKMADELGITIQAVSEIRMKDPNRVRTLRDIAYESYPIREHTFEQARSQHSRMLHAHAAWIATRGEGMTRRTLVSLRRFYARLENEGLIVEFRPYNPPSRENKFGGYIFAVRGPKDEDFLIRRNRWTNLTPETENLWRFPPVRPT